MCYKERVPLKCIYNVKSRNLGTETVKRKCSFKLIREITKLKLKVKEQNVNLLDWGKSASAILTFNKNGRQRF